jgi:DNA-binding NarL/FixJ family response regulator
MHVVLLCSDLATSSKLSAAATRQGLTLAVAFSVEALLKNSAAQPTGLVILDLSFAGLVVADALARLRSLPLPPGAVIAFGPHVHENLLAAASAAGCDRVLSRGQMIGRAEEIFVEFAR